MAGKILGRKIGMTQVFVEDRAVGATVVEAEPCKVIRVKTVETDGYNALQLGHGEIKESKTTKPLLGHYRKAEVAPCRRLFEVRVPNPAEYHVGESVGVDIFSEGEKIDVAGISKGLGFQGVVKRWGFAGGPKSHGSNFHRRPGSIGTCVEPGHVTKGKKMPGHAGARRVTVKGLEVLRVDRERNLLVLRGATPGARGTILELGKRHG